MRGWAEPQRRNPSSAGGTSGAWWRTHWHARRHNRQEARERKIQGTHRDGFDSRGNTRVVSHGDPSGEDKPSDKYSRQHITVLKRKTTEKRTSDVERRPAIVGIRDHAALLGCMLAALNDGVKKGHQNNKKKAYGETLISLRQWRGEVVLERLRPRCRQAVTCGATSRKSSKGKIPQSDIIDCATEHRRRERTGRRKKEGAGSAAGGGGGKRETRRRLLPAHQPTRCHQITPSVRARLCSDYDKIMIKRSFNGLEGFLANTWCPACAPPPIESNCSWFSCIHL
ncbi:hypothetical protein B0H17DRAFT_1152028 [Mycena rosella]|uniref:Uncharacterized protein n=1 Tax=Mycena rosella TaxID=1033263 RepID=A0AAD7BH75_MYCRO|nr:hypothetical protein B0H17DRAFT_1152028 [Mycena rosella]